MGSSSVAGKSFSLVPSTCLFSSDWKHASEAKQDCSPSSVFWICVLRLRGLVQWSWRDFRVHGLNSFQVSISWKEHSRSVPGAFQSQMETR